MEANDSANVDSSPSRLWRVFKGVGALVVVFVGVVLIAGFIAHESRPPTGTQGDDADELARRIEAATDQAAWNALPAVSWEFGGRNEHLWDRERGYVRTTTGDSVALMRMDGSGIGYVDGERDDSILDAAFGRFINDSFWLNPFGKAFDEGVTRSIVERADGQALFVEFASGGRTPGDGYMIYSDENGLPTRWEMWVNVLPVGGVGCSWSDWQTLDGGARASGLHETSLVDLRLTNIRGGTLTTLTGGEDPFEALE